MFKTFKLHWVLYVISLSISVMNRTKTSVWFFFDWFNRVLNEVAFMLWIKNDSFLVVVETDHLSIIKILVWMIKESEVDRDQLECFELKRIEKIEINVKREWVSTDISDNDDDNVECIVLFTKMSWLYKSKESSELNSSW